MAGAEVPIISVVLRKSYAAGFYAMCAPGFEPRATLALPTATIGTMAAEASVNAMYASKVAAIADEAERAAFVAARVAEQQADVNLLRMGGDLVVDALVEPEDLRSESPAGSPTRTAGLAARSAATTPTARFEPPAHDPHRQLWGDRRPGRQRLP